MPMKRLVLVFGLIGFIGCFLPMLGELSWFDLRHFDEGWTVWLVIAAFALPTVLGFSKSMRLADAAGATTGFGYVLWKFHGDLWNLIFHTAIGGMMMGIAAVVGFLVSLGALVQAAKSKAAA